MIFLFSFFKALSKALFYFFALIFSWVLCLYLRSDIQAPRLVPSQVEWDKAKEKSLWFDKKEYGINHVFLKGSAFERGLAWGTLPGSRLYDHEKTLIDMYSTLIPSPWKRKILETSAMALFQGLDHGFEPWMKEEMWGVSQSASSEFNSLASPFARQLAHHGIFEVGQLFVDLAPLEGACTFVGYPLNGKWIVGRTFDFEGGRIFDEQKVVKWVYPESGLKYVSVIWTGMVGAVSGVNEKGLYVSLNVAGSRDMNLLGLPSTLLLSKVLQEATTLEEALKIFRDNPSMLTAIYMVLDSNTGRLYKVEKSAFRLDMSEVKDAGAVTNHLTADVFKDDDFNVSRRDNFTSTFRLKRANELLLELKKQNPKERGVVTKALLKILRDKGVSEAGTPLHLGNRRAIDALIASHGVLFDSAAQTLYVSEGPAMAGAFRAFDIAKSFSAGKPVELAGLPKDNLVSEEKFEEIKEKLAQLKGVFELIKEGNCQKASADLKAINSGATPASSFQHVEYEYAALQVAKCLNLPAEAKLHAQKGLDLVPPHLSLKEYFQQQLQPNSQKQPSGVSL